MNFLIIHPWKNSLHGGTRIIQIAVESMRWYREDEEPSNWLFYE